MPSPQPSKYQAPAPPEPPPGSSHALAIERVPPGSRVLDLGCSAGQIGAWLASRRCAVDGVERDPTRAAAARESGAYGEVWMLDLSDAGSLALAWGERRWDRVLLLDVLEHLDDPVALLWALPRWLAPGGRVVVSLPNAAHASVRLELLRGSFAPEEAGLLDGTHLHFLTRAGALERIGAAGLVPVWEGYTAMSLSEETIARHLAAVGLPLTPAARAALSAPEAVAWQWLWELRPAQAGEPTAPTAPAPKPADDELLLRRRQAEDAACLGASLQLERARREEIERQLQHLSTTKAWQAVHRWWQAKATGQRALRLLRGAGTKGQLERVGIAWRLLRTIGPRRLGEVLLESVRGTMLPPPPGDHPRADGPPPRVLEEGPLISVLLAVCDPEPAWLEAALASVRAQSYARWELCVADDASTRPEVRALLERAALLQDGTGEPRVRLVRREQRGGISRALNAALGLARGEWVTTLDHDDELAPHALAWVAWVAREEPGADVVYTDEEKLDERGRPCEPFFKPDWAPDYALSTHYACHLTAFRRELLQAVGGYRPEYDGAQDYDLLLRASERARAIRHVPRLLYRWRKVRGSTSFAVENKPAAVEAGRRAVAEALRRRGEPGRVEAVPGLGACYRVIRELPARPLVSILIPTRDRLDLLRDCVESVAALSSYPHREVVVIDNGSREPATLEWLRAQEARGALRVVRVAERFNFSRLINRGAEEAKGEVLVLLNNDTKVLAPGWIEAMLEHALRPGVGAVGAKLLYPDGTVQHAGVVLGLVGVAGHAYCGCPAGHPGVGGRAALIGNWSAVTAACVMLTREAFRAVGGMDEGFPINFGDVDLCLRLSAAGLRTVWTPHALLEHRESASRHKSVDPAEEALLLRRFSGLIARDPLHNENLSRRRADLTWDPVPG